MDENLRARYRSSSPQPSRRIENPQRPLSQSVPVDDIHPSLKHAYQPPPQAAEPAQPVIPLPTTAPRPEYHRRTRPKRKKFLIVLVVILALASAAGLWAYPKYTSQNPFPADIQANAGYSLFYPKKLPTGYSIDKASIVLDKGIVNYIAKNGALHLVFTIQSIPPQFDFKTFYQQGLKNAQNITTANGQAVIGKVQDRFVGSLASGDGWILLSTNSSQVSIADMSLVLTNLKQY